MQAKRVRKGFFLPWIIYNMIFRSTLYTCRPFRKVVPLKTLASTQTFLGSEESLQTIGRA
jgi:hypothetical protein